MHICFVHSHYESLAVEYLSSILKKNGHKTSLIFDPALFHNFFLDKNYLSRIFNFKNYILRKIEKDKPDIVAFSVISDNYGWILEIAKQIKSKINTTIVFGGIHPTAVPDHVLNDRVADYIVIGEGEYAFLDLVNALDKKQNVTNIQNIGSYNDGDMYINQVRKPITDLDALPFPDKDLFYDQCKMMVRDSYMIMGSRGCTNSCSYCWNSTINKVYSSNIYYRRRSPVNVIEELKWAIGKYKIKKVTFYDEVFTSDKKWLIEFLSLYKESIALPYFCCVHPRDIDKKIVNLLSGSGCAALNIGVQTANEITRVNILNRPGSNQQIIDALRALRGTRIFVYSNIILGLPNETESDLIATLSFCNSYKADLPAIYWLRYYPGTKIIEIARNKLFITDDEVAKINESKDYSPYAISGSTYCRDVARIGNLILLSGVIPKAIMDRLIRFRIYRFMPSVNLLFPVIIFMSYLKVILEGKRCPFHYFSLFTYLKYHFFYMYKRMFCYLGIY
ncbi:MAG: radical SAM protein [Candidatus Omnitrophica bacterium]|jgi:radical SAM superfamily enzyme YgiQ (UPF0313 family)|nr:radical SAM protein [Candidatus Omnitrophota bacterium]